MEDKEIHAIKQLLDIMNSVNTFYESAWTKLLIFITIFVTVIGVIIPIAIQWWQRRYIKLREAELKRHLSELVKSEMEIVRNEIKSQVAAGENLAHEKMKLLEEKLLKKISSASGGLFHIQGNINKQNGSIPLAIIDHTTASMTYLECKDELNLGRVLNGIPELLESSYQKDFENIDDLEEKLSALIKVLEENNENKRYSDIIRKIRKRIVNAKRRTENPRKAAV